MDVHNSLYLASAMLVDDEPKKVFFHFNSHTTLEGRGKMKSFGHDVDHTHEFASIGQCKKETAVDACVGRQHHKFKFANTAEENRRFALDDGNGKLDHGRINVMMPLMRTMNSETHI